MFYFTTLLLLATSLTTNWVNSTEAPPPYEIVEDQSITPVLNPTFSDVQTLKLRLKNGLEMILVSDPGVDSSSASLAVGTGSWEDPAEHPGMAHFLEHMLFLGTKKYPDESSYQRFILEHNGKYNAFTASDTTTYLFSIDSKAYPEAIDRLASFFKEPLFNPSGVERELNAIDQEHAKNLDSDSRREYFVHKELTNPNHPNRSFSTGNRETLKNVTQEELKKWFHTHYSANRMRLTAISSLPLESLRDIAVAAFSDIPNLNLPELSVDHPLIQDAIKGHMVYIRPVKNIRQLSIIWDLPSSLADQRATKPEELIAYILAHQGRSSLIAELKRRNLAASLDAEGHRMGGNNYQFTIQINLTDEGVKQVDQVIQKTFEAIANLKQRGIPQYLFDEVHAMTRVNYQYQTRTDAFRAIMATAMMLSKEPLATYPEETCLICSFDPQGVKEILEVLSPKQAVYDLIAPESLTGVPFDRRERWMGVDYTVKSIDQETLLGWELALPTPWIDLPSFNPFIPESLTVHGEGHRPSDEIQSTILPTPSLIHDSDLGKFYAAQDQMYLIPQITWSFYIRTPAITPENPETIVLADLYANALSDELRSYTYPAAVAGLNFSAMPRSNGVELIVTGYSDKAEELFNDLIKATKAFKPEENAFKNFKELLKKQYKNLAVDMPIAQASEHLNNALYKNYVTEQEKARTIKRVSFSRFKEFTSQLFNETYVEGMLYGNMPNGQAQRLTETLLNTLGSAPYSRAAHFADEVITLPADKGPFYLEPKSSSPSNAAILTIEVAPYSLKAKAANIILMQAIQQPFFSTLRTKQQTGYIVQSRAEDKNFHLFNTFMVQSNTHDGRDLLSRFELFIEEFMAEISRSEVTPDRFENIRHGILSQLRQPPKSIQEMGSKLSVLASKYDADFERDNKLIQAFEELSYLEFLDFAHDALGKGNKRRLAILMKGTGSSDVSLDYTKINTIDKLHKESSYVPVGISGESE